MNHSFKSANKSLLVCVLLLLISTGYAAAPNAQLENPDFEIGQIGQIPDSWRMPQAMVDQGFSAVTTDLQPKSGKYCAEVRWPDKRTKKNAPFANLVQSIDAAPYRGKQIKVTSAIRVASGKGNKRAQMWLRVDRIGGGMSFLDNMYNRPIQSQTWADYTITAEIADNAERILLGLMTFEGETAWWDHIRIETLDQKARPLEERELQNLVAFTRLLGFVKHYHPSDAAAASDWPRFVTAALPKVEKAQGPADLAAALQAVFSPIAPTIRVFETGQKPALPPELLPPKHAGSSKICCWEHHGYQQEDAVKMEDVYSSQRNYMDVEDSADLPAYARPIDVYRSDLGAGVSCMVPTALYADEKGTLPHTMAGPETNLPEANLREQRLATVMIAWNVLEHFYPYFDVVEVDWPKQLEIALSSASAVRDNHDFYNTLFRMIVSLQDGHGTLSGPGMNLEASLPLQIELIEGQITVIRVTDGAGDVQPGDAVQKIDGTAAMEEFEKRTEWSADSTPQGKNYKAAFFFGWGDHGSQATLEIKGKDGKIRTVTMARCDRLPNFETGLPPTVDEIRPGVFYVDLTRITKAQIDKNMTKLAEAEGLVFDLRGYPTRDAPELFQHMSPKPLQSVLWGIPVTHRPDHTDVQWDGSGRWALEPLQPQLTSNRAFLTDGSAISFSETLMGLVEGLQLGEIVGQPTAGTNGNLCMVQLPAGYRMAFTGMRTLKHDGSRHHGVGILPTVPVAKTIQGVRDGRDEQLEQALRLVGVSQTAIAGN